MERHGGKFFIILVSMVRRHRIPPLEMRCGMMGIGEVIFGQSHCRVFVIISEEWRVSDVRAVRYGAEVVSQRNT